MKPHYCSRLMTVGVILGLFFFVTGCGFKLRTADYTLINTGSALHITPITSDIFNGEIERRLAHALGENVRGKKGIRITPEKDADITIDVHISQYDEHIESQPSGIHTLRHTLVIAIRATDRTSETSPANEITIKPFQERELSGSTADAFEIDDNQNKLAILAAEEIIRQIVLR